MTSQPGDEPSFDPRTWRHSADAANKSLNPGLSSDQSTPTKADGGSKTVAKPPKSARGRLGRTAAIVGVLTVLAAGVVTARLTATKPPQQRAAPVASPHSETLAASSPQGSPSLQRMSSGLAAMSGLAQALVAFGSPSADAQAASQALARFIDPAASGLHLTAFLAPSAAGEQLVRVEVRHDDGSGAAAELTGGKFVGSPLVEELVTRASDVRGELNADDFYSSAVAAGVPDSLIHDFAQAFTYDFDFEREIKQGDVFEVVYSESVGPSGQVIGEPKLLLALLTTDLKSVELYRFQPPGEKDASWFDANGRAAARGLMRTPVEGARVSSPFGMRMHPILGFMKMHKGVDFAAVTGTPIYAAADGLVEFSGMKGPDGNFVQLRHDNGWQSLYLHMNKIMPGVATGSRVRQGEQIGEVGSTGVDSSGHSTVTGPHLHFEVHINDQPVDPLSLPIQAGKTLAGQGLVDFFKERKRIDALRVAQPA